MNPVRLSDNNATLGVDQKGVRPVHVTRWKNTEGLPVVSIGWQPDHQELERLLQGLPVIVDVIGYTMQPMVVRVGEPAEETT